MVRLEGGAFLMGTDDSLGYESDGEGPVHEVTLRPFLIDTEAVTNARFRQFVQATGHVTTAERFGWSFVFGGLLPDEFPDTRGVVQAPWWRQVYGADWSHPEGPQSDVADRERPSGGPRLVGRRRGVLRVGREPASDRSRVGVRGPGRTRAAAVPVG